MQKLCIINIRKTVQVAGGDNCIIQPFKEGAQTALFKDPVRTAL